MCLMWGKSELPAMAGARFVVSERGESLSPKQAPETTAPATMPAGIPKPMPMPVRAIPTVPAVPQEVPVARDTIQQITKVAARNTPGERICRPQQIMAGMVPLKIHSPIKVPTIMSIRIACSVELSVSLIPCSSSPQGIPSIVTATTAAMMLPKMSGI